MSIGEYDSSTSKTAATNLISGELYRGTVLDIGEQNDKPYDSHLFVVRPR
jgi:hypothetical protein